MVETTTLKFSSKGAAAERLWVPGDTSEDLPIELEAKQMTRSQILPLAFESHYRQTLVEMQKKL